MESHTAIGEGISVAWLSSPSVITAVSAGGIGGRGMVVKTSSLVHNVSISFAVFGDNVTLRERPLRRGSARLTLGRDSAGMSSVLVDTTVAEVVIIAAEVVDDDVSGCGAVEVEAPVGSVRGGWESLNRSDDKKL